MAKVKKSSLRIETTLSRDIGLTTALAIGVGTMIAAGIFTLSGLAVRNVGSAAIVAFLLAAIVAVFTALTYCEFVSIYPESGEGYLYVRKTFPGPFAYFVGWALILGYTSSCAFYISSLSSYFYEFVLITPFKMLSGSVILVGLILLNIKGTKESGAFQVVITISKVILLAWFVTGGLSSVNMEAMIEQFNTDIMKIGSTAGMVFITFFGFSAIAASAGEVKDPVKTIPRAIFLAMIIVTILYSLVIIVVVAAGLTEYTEAAMGVAARQFLGPIGGMVIVAGAIFSMISASNASIMAGSRVTLTMSLLNHFPKGFGVIDPRTRTPIMALFLVGGLILVFSISLPLEELAHFADTVLLLVMILVNAALIYHRRKYPDMERPFRVPLVPFLPGLGIVANLYLLVQISHHLAPVIMAIICLALGMILFLVWKGLQPEEMALPGAPTRVALGRYALKESQFRVLVPLANPTSVSRLMELAAAVASPREGGIVALRTTLVPEQFAPSEDVSFIEQEREILEMAHTHAQKDDIPISSLVCVGHNTARVILETSREQNCDLILMGWKGFTSTGQRILGEITDAVITHARRDIMLVKPVGNKPLRKILFPTTGGPHASHAEQYVASIARYFDASVTVCGVALPSAPKTMTTKINTRLNETVARLMARNELTVNSKIISHHSVAEAIIQTAKKYDAVVIGAAGYGLYKQILFGSIPETIARHTTRTVILVKHHQPARALVSRVMKE